MICEVGQNLVWSRATSLLHYPTPPYGNKITMFHNLDLLHGIQTGVLWIMVEYNPVTFLRRESIAGILSSSHSPSYSISLSLSLSVKGFQLIEINLRFVDGILTEIALKTVTT